MATKNPKQETPKEDEAAKSAPSTSTEVAAPASTAVAVADDYAAYAGSGFENQTSDDYAIPFLGILQALSPEIAANPELRQGSIINTVTGEVFTGSVGVAFVPATTQHTFVEWVPREKGGGFVAVHDPAGEVVLKAKEEAKAQNLPFGELHVGANDLIETFYVYGVAVDADNNSIECTLAFSATKIKAYKGWMTKAKTIQIPLPDGRRIPAPLFAHRYRLKTISEKNNKGQFFNWVVEFDGANATECRLKPSEELFQKAVGLKGLLDTGKARAAYESQAAGSGKDETMGSEPGKPVF